jgi:hypothetical protein
MKKKGNRSIPDFARAKPMSAAPPRDADAPVRHGVPGRQGTIKPQATSAKSGRRGQ